MVSHFLSGTKGLVKTKSEYNPRSLSDLHLYSSGFHNMKRLGVLVFPLHNMLGHHRPVPIHTLGGERHCTSVLAKNTLFHAKFRILFIRVNIQQEILNIQLLCIHVAGLLNANY